MEAVRTAWNRKGIDPQHLDSGVEGHLVGEEEREGKGLVWLVGGRDRHADTPAAEVHGFLKEDTLRRVRLRLNADGQKDGDAIKLAAFPSGRL